MSKKWKTIEEDSVRNIWKSNNGEEIAIEPSWYAENGTPIDDIGDDFEYIRTEIAQPKKEYITMKDLVKDNGYLKYVNWTKVDIEDHIDKYFGYTFKGHDYVSFEYRDIHGYLSQILEE